MQGNQDMKSTPLNKLSDENTGQLPQQQNDNPNLVKDILDDLNNDAEPDYDEQYEQNQHKLQNQQFDVLHNYQQEYESPTIVSQIETKIVGNKLLDYAKTYGVLFVLIILISIPIVSRTLGRLLLKILKSNINATYALPVLKSLIICSIYFIILTFIFKK
jgi:hypothetical protein